MSPTCSPHPECGLKPGSEACLSKTWRGKNLCQECEWWAEFCNELLDVD